MAGTGRAALAAVLVATMALAACSAFAGDARPAVPDSARDREALPRPTPGAVDVDAVDMWHTGVNATAAVVMTPVFPGWGQLYARNSWHAALGFGAQMYFWTNLLVRDRRAVRAKTFSRTFAPDDPNFHRYDAIAQEDWAQMRDFAWWSGGALLIIALDAYVGAHLFNFDRDPLPVPDRWNQVFGDVSLGGPSGNPGPTVVVFQWRKTF